MVLTTALSFAQNSSITTAGENVSNDKKIVNWSIGHLVTTAGNSSTYKVYSGAETPKYHIYYDKNNDGLVTKCYPNPAKDYFIMELQTNDLDCIKWQLTNSKGDKITEGESNYNNIKIDISSLSASTYFLMILDKNNNKISSAKLLKL